MSARKMPVIRYRGQRWWWRWYSLCIAFVVVWLLIILLSAPPVAIGYSIYLTAFLVIFVTVLGLTTPAWRKIKLTESALCIPQGFGRVKIPVSEVAGIGLLYRYWPSMRGLNKTKSWDLFVWRADGSYVSDFAVSYVDMHQKSSGPIRLRPRLIDDTYVASMVGRFDVPRLAASKPALVAADLYRRIVSIQGRDGPLAVLQLQKHASWSNQDRAPLNVAFWSPDGEVGACRWAQEREIPETRPEDQPDWAYNRRPPAS
jgi:hypothetical protein